MTFLKHKQPLKSGFQSAQFLCKLNYINLPIYIMRLQVEAQNLAMEVGLGKSTLCSMALSICTLSTKFEVFL